MRSIILLLCLVVSANGATETIHFGYDAAGRLESYAAGNTARYTYDRAGNLLQSGTATADDSDLDGLADAWERANFSSLERTGDEDFDLDGLNDRSEFLAGTNPKDPSSVLHLSLQFHAAQVTLRWAGNAGRNYRVQYKNSLSDATWANLSELLSGSAAPMESTDSLSPFISRFYRLELLP